MAPQSRRSPAPLRRVLIAAIAAIVGASPLSLIPAVAVQAASLSTSTNRSTPSGQRVEETITRATKSTAASTSQSLPDVSGFQVATVFHGLSQPTAIQFAPDGRVFVAEKSGLIKVFDSLSDTSPDIFADLRTNVHNYWDRGLLDMVLDPAFPTRPYVYVFYVYDAPIGGTAPTWGVATATSDGCPSPPGPTTDGCVVSSRLSRLTASGNAMTGPEEVLINDWCQQFPSHSGSGMAFGPDGALYITGGEGAAFHTNDWGQLGGSAGSPTLKNPCGDPPGGVGGTMAPPTTEGGSLRAQDLRTPGDPVTLDGSLIRVNPDTGQAAAGNPVLGVDANTDRIIAYGFRNPFRLTVRPGTGEVWIGDVGDIRWEEINRIQNPTASVLNFGWPCYEGVPKQPAWDFNDINICENLYASPGAVTAPYVAYPHDAPQVFPGNSCPTAGASISGLQFYTGSNYPAAYQGALFASDYTRKCVWVLPLGNDGQPDVSQATTVVSANGGPTDLKAGPGGDLFFTDYDGGNIKRIQWFATNHPPTARISTDVSDGAPPLTVQFDGSNSSDPENDTLTYAWDLDGDGQTDDSTAVNPSFTYDTAGSYTVTLVVTDTANNADSKTRVISVGNTPPVPTITAPVSTDHWQVGTTIAFSGTATDPDEGDLGPADLSWELVMHHCATLDSCHTHIIQDYPGVASGSFAAPDHGYPSYLELILTATDSGGLSVSTNVRLDPLTVDVSVQTVPTGLSLAVGSASGPAPFSVTVIRGDALSLAAPTTQSLDGVAYAFDSWSDSGAAAHGVTASATTTFTATYRVVPSGNFAQDAFARTSTGSWGTADLGGAWSILSDPGKFTVAGGVGTAKVSAGQSRGAILPISVRDVDLSFAFSTDKAATGSGQYAYVVARRNGTSAEYRLHARIRPGGQVYVQAGRVNGGGEQAIGTEVAVDGLTVATSGVVRVRARVTGASPTTIKMRAWADGSTEPTEWTYQATDSTAALQVAGAIGLLTYLPSDVTNAPVTFRFDDLVAKPPASAPPPPADLIAQDAFARSRTGLWGTADFGGDWTVVGGPANFLVSGGAGIMKVAAASTRGASLPVSARDIDLTFSVTTDKQVQGNGQYAYGVARRVSSGNEYRGFLRIRANGAAVLTAVAVTGGTERLLLPAVNVAPAGTYLPGQVWHLRLRVTGATPTTVQARAWIDGATEPTAWDIQTTDSTSVLQAPGAIALLAYLASGSAEAPVAFTFDNVDARIPAVTPPPPADLVGQDAFGRTAATGWGNADVGGAWTLTGAAGNFAVGGGVGTMRMGAGQTRGASLTINVRDVNLSFSCTTDKTPVGTGQYAYAVVRRVSTGTEYRAAVRFRPNGALNVYATAVTSGTEHTLSAVAVPAPAGTYVAGQVWHVRLRVTGASPTTIQIRVWRDGTAEPSTWTVQVTDSTPELQVGGAVALLGYLATAAPEAPVTESFDDVDVRSIP